MHRQIDLLCQQCLLELGHPPRLVLARGPLGPGTLLFLLLARPFLMARPSALVFARPVAVARAAAMSTVASAIGPGELASAAWRFVHGVAARAHHDDLGSAQPLRDK